jgi:hypothetical protein
MKVLGYIMLHYGKEYLAYALNPLCEVCDKVIILYSLVPTHNNGSGQLNPDTRDELKAIANKFEKVEWIDITANNESDHRGKIFYYTSGYDVLVNADYDEVWEVEDLKRAVKEVYNSPYRAHGIDGYVTFWRSFRYEVTTNKQLNEKGEYEYNKPADEFLPVRLWHLREKNTDKQPTIKAKIYHFGYAIKRRTMMYKKTIHGHKDDWSSGWDNKWHSWHPSITEGSFHPCSRTVWLKIEPFNRNELPLELHKHVYFNKEII